MLRCINRSVLFVTRLGIATALTYAASACSDSDSVSPSTPHAINVTIGAAQTGVVNTPLPSNVVVEVTSSSGTPIAGATVTFTPSATSGTVSAATITTDANGLAAVTWTLGTIAGTDTLFAMAGADSTTIVATARPDVAANLAVVAGNNQTASSGSALTPLSVKVTDQYGNAVANVPVQWTDDAGGTFSTTTSLTDSTGVATTTYTLNGTGGVADVTASASSGTWSSSTAFTEDGN